MKMKVTKFLASIIMIIAVFCIVFGQTATYAADSVIYVGISEMNESGIAYAIDAPDSGGEHPGRPIWDLVSYTNESATTRTNPQKNLYCVKGGVGFQDTSDKVTYNQSYDFRTQKSAIASLVNDSDSYSINALYSHYSEILCLLDNIYIPGVSTDAEKTAILKAAGIDDSEGELAVFPLTDDDIETVQQLAFWYYTNDGDGKNPSYHQDDLSRLYIMNSEMTQYTDMQSYHSGSGEGAIKYTKMQMLYSYLLDYVNANKDKYSSVTELGDPVTIGTGTLQLADSGDDYLVGPINITKNNNLPYTLGFVVKNASGSTIDSSTYSFVNASGSAIDKDTTTGDIYIKIPKSNGNKLSVEITTNYSTTDALLWKSGNDTTAQPLLEVDKTPHNPKVELSTNPSSPFDLALRKFITAISSDSTIDDTDRLTGTNSREPVLSDLDKLKDGTVTTATYSHSKTPLKVENGDYIEYTIRVYNEGEAAGYAEEISDYILNNQGLEFAEGHVTNTEYGWTKTGNTVKTDYLSRSKNATGNLLAAFDSGRTTPDYRDLKIVFKVTEPNSSDNKLVNIAEITDDCDENGNEVTDRDSTPGGKDSKNYPENGYNTETHEDDIDYEPVELKIFDLALRKFITAISSDTTIDESEYLTGSDSREPVVTYENRQLVYTHPKNPLSVKSGDYVLYTIRVYNEGEIDGYASLIRDNIPEGLSYDATVLDHKINKDNMWTIDSTNGSITTDILAKGKGKEDGAQPGDANYTANLLKAFDSSKSISNTTPLNPDYRDVQVLLHVTEANESSRILDNRAQIADDSDEDGNEVEDKDSHPNEWNDGEDDQDHDPVKLQIFDLALRKFITNVDGTEITNRVPSVVADDLVDGTATTATYNHTKQPLEVSKGSKIVYTIRVYNEGDVDGYASEITDFLPPELEIVPASESEINTLYGWTEVEGSNGRRYTTTYLAPKDGETAANSKKLKAREDDKLDFDEVQIECKLKDTAQIENKITNIAEISEYRDNNGNPINPDRDSKSNSLTDEDNVKDNLPSDEGLPTYKDDEINKEYVPGQEDDDDFEKIIVRKKVDLALTKFITAISTDENIEDGEYLTPNKNVGSETNPYDRQTAVNTNPLKQGEHDAKYTQVKTPLLVGNNSYVLYNIRVYNEGEVDVYAGEVTDYLPENLEFIDGEFNRQYGWTANGQTVKTTYLSAANGADKMLKAFDSTNDDGAGSGLDYKDLPILCRVSSTAPSGVKLINSAEISKYQDKDGNDLPKDIDSTPENLDDNKKNKEGNPEGRYDEDDEDYDVVLVRKVDLALTKFITAISTDENIEDGEYLTPNKNIGSETNPYDRQTAVDTNPLKQGEHDAKYTQVKTPLNVNRNSFVLYNIRVYNEGEVDVFAGEVTDYLPENLDFVDGEFNKQYGWTADGQTVKTTYLSSANGVDKILKAFDKTNDDGAGSGLDYKDLPILCQVNSKTPTAKELVNTAEVTKYEDEDGKEIPNDIDSTPENKKTKNDKNREEDDDDYEVVIVEEFDLSLLKYVSHVIVTEDGKTKTTATHNTGNNETDIIPKVEIHRKKLNSTTVKFVYTIRITNEGDIAGYAKEITDYVPEGLSFHTEDNNNWTVKSDGVIATRALENTLLQPGESADVQVTFRWINGANNLNLKRNTAEISEDYNDKHVPDRDSVPNNKKPGEDDIDIADVLLSIKTGAAATYVLLTGTILLVLASGIILVKKYAM